MWFFGFSLFTAPVEDAASVLPETTATYYYLGF